MFLTGRPIADFLFPARWLFALTGLSQFFPLAHQLQLILAIHLLQFWNCQNHHKTCMCMIQSGKQKKAMATAVMVLSWQADVLSKNQIQKGFCCEWNELNDDCATTVWQKTLTDQALKLPNLHFSQNRWCHARFWLFLLRKEMICEHQAREMACSDACHVEKLECQHPHITFNASLMFLALRPMNPKKQWWEQQWRHAFCWHTLVAAGLMHWVISWQGFWWGVVGGGSKNDCCVCSTGKHLQFDSVPSSDSQVWHFTPQCSIEESLVKFRRSFFVLQNVVKESPIAELIESLKLTSQSCCSSFETAAIFCTWRKSTTIHIGRCSLAFCNFHWHTTTHCYSRLTLEHSSKSSVAFLNSREESHRLQKRRKKEVILWDQVQACLFMKRSNLWWWSELQWVDLKFSCGRG